MTRYPGPMTKDPASPGQHPVALALLALLVGLGVVMMLLYAS